MNKIKIGSDFSGVGAFIQALLKLGIPFEEVFACDQDKYARETYILNYGDPGYFPMNVYDREVPEDPMDIYVSTPPCQSFSIAGKGYGEDDDRGILFYNSHDFIRKNNPRYFIFENVKGLLSDDKKNKKDKMGRTFRRWLDYLGGKSVNGDPVLFPHENSVPYHIYYKVLNAKEHGVPQNRERVFIVGIRDDSDNHFRFPKKIPLKNKIIDILESEVDDKYFLSEEMIEKAVAKKTGLDIKTLGFINQDTQASKIYCENGVSPTLSAGTHGYANGYVLVSKEVRTEEAKAQRRQTGTNDFRGKKLEFRESDVMNCLSTSPTNDNLIKIGTWRTHKDRQGFREIKDGVCPTMSARAREDGSGQPVIMYDSFIRRLTPREWFRLMDFPDSFIWKCSDTQAYKQAGNSIVRECLILIIKQLKFE